MVQAKTGILVDQTTYELCKSSSSSTISFKELAPIKVKGKAHLVPVFEPKLNDSFIAKRGITIIGRSHEIDQVQQIANRIQQPDTDKSEIIFMEGLPGVGKVHNKRSFQIDNNKLLFFFFDRQN